MPNYGLLYSGGIDSKVCRHMYPDAKLYHYNWPDDKDFTDDAEVEVIDISSYSNKAEGMTANTIALLEDATLGLDNIILGINRPYDELMDLPDAPQQGTNSLVKPLENLQKHEVIKYASENNIDLTDTISCLRVLTHEGCGECYQCIEKKKALAILDDEGFDYSNVI